MIRITGPLVRGTEQWIPLTKGQWCYANIMMASLCFVGECIDRSTLPNSVHTGIRFMLWLITTNTLTCNAICENLSICDKQMLSNCFGQHTLIARFMGPTWPRWSPCWPHEFCYLGSYWFWWACKDDAISRRNDYTYWLKSILLYWVDIYAVGLMICSIKVNGIFLNMLNRGQHIRLIYLLTCYRFLWLAACNFGYIKDFTPLHNRIWGSVKVNFYNSLEAFWC